MKPLRLFPASMNFKLPGFLVVFLLGGLATTQAQLSWEKTLVELHPKAGDAEAVANFKYENKGKTPIKITSVKSSCGCTAVSTKKDEVGPGEKGEVVATFHIGGRTGVQEKGITVETNDASQPIMNLTLKAVIEQPVEIQPTFVYWQAGEEPKPKSVKVTAGKDVTLTKLDVTSSSPVFTSKVEKSSRTGEFTISVQPKDTAEPVSATLTVKSDLPQPYFVMARVIAPAAAAH